MSNFKSFKNGIAACLILLSGIFFVSCQNDSPLSPAHQDITAPGDNVQFNYIGTPNLRNIPGGILILDTVKVLIKDIKLHGANSGGDNVKVGPYVLYVNCGGGIVQFIASNMIPPGTYDKIIFKLHKPNPNENISDPEFTDGGRYSAIVKGRYDGVPFVFKSDKTFHQMLDFNNEVIITTYLTNVTVRIYPYLWFLDNNASGYVDPSDPGNSNQIEHNIRENVNQNFKAFRDNNQDGSPD